MQQQRLQLPLPCIQDEHAWVHHAGTSMACSRLSVWLIHGGTLWLKSHSPAGKSHLLHILKTEHPHLGVVHLDASLSNLKQVDAWLKALDAYAHWAIDLPAGAITYAHAIAIFHLIERAKMMNRPLLISWRCKDKALATAELASRMRVMEQVEISPPEHEEDLSQVLQAVAKQLHWDIPQALLTVMLTHLPRDLETQIKALRHLEAASLSERARMSQAWAKQTLCV